MNNILNNLNVINPDTNRQINSLAGKRKLILNGKIAVPNGLVVQKNLRPLLKLSSNQLLTDLNRAYIQIRPRYYVGFVDVYTDDIYDSYYTALGNSWNTIFGTIKDTFKKANLPQGKYRMLVRADEYDENGEKVGTDTIQNTEITIKPTINQTKEANKNKFYHEEQSGLNNFILDSMNLQNFDGDQKAYQNIRVIFIKPSTINGERNRQIKQVIQRFQIGDFNCVLKAMLKTIEDSINKNKDKNKKYIQRLKNIRKKIIKYNDDFPEGLTYEDIEHILTDLPFTVRIYDLIQQNYMEFKHKNPIFNVKYINTAFNHVEQLISNNPVFDDDLYKKYKSGELPYFKQGGYITPEGIIRPKADEYLNEMFKPFIPMITDAKNMGNDFAHVLNSIHYFSSWINYNKNLKTVRNIDMPKCYAKFHECDYYKGFPVTGPQITGALESDFNLYKNYEGFITISHVDYSNADPQIIEHIEHLNVFEIANLTFPIPELRYYYDLGITFKCEYGSFCLSGNIDIPITDDILKYKTYQKFTGIAGSHLDHRNFTVKADKFIIEKLASDYKYDYFIIPDTDQAYISLTFTKKKINSYPHVCAYMLSYARIRMFKQLFTIPVNQIRGIIADDIIINAEYQPVLFKTHSYDKFDNKTSEELLTKANRLEPCKFLLSSYDYVTHYKLGITENITSDHLKDLFHKNIHAFGGPGNGKSFYYLTLCSLYILNNAIYITDNHRQLTSKKEEFPIIRTETVQKLLDSPNQNYQDISLFIVDEYSKFTQQQIIKLKSLYPYTMLIVCGDKLQLPPCQGTQYNFYNDNDFYDIEFKQNYRFKDDEIKKLCDEMRQILINTKHNGIKIKKCMNLIKDYDKIKLSSITDNDIILTSKNEQIDKITEILKNKLTPKYMVKKTTKDHKLLAGQIISSYDEEYKKYVKLQHAFTIHSFQGETLKDNQRLIIDLKDHFEANMLYVQVSRCKRNTQIFLLDDTPE